MRRLAVVMSLAVVGSGAVWAQSQLVMPQSKAAVAPTPPSSSTPVSVPASESVSTAVQKGARWLASVQGADGGWGQDGGEAAVVRQGERLESSGNDVANTAVAALALMQSGTQYTPQVERAVTFILRRIEASPADGLAVTDRQGTQIQRKLGPYIDTFLSSMLMSQMDGRASTPALNARVRNALQKTVAKIQKHQQSDGSWNNAGGWAPVLGTSLASRSLFEAQKRGVAVDAATLKRAESYTVNAIVAPPTPAARVVVDGVGVGRGAGLAAAPAESAGVALYQSGQALEQLSRTPADRAKNAAQISAIQGQLSDAAFVRGFGSMGGEELFSYLNISDSMKRVGGEAWTKWHADITQKVLGLQNNDGTWAGHHCITGRVAMTSAAILNLTVDRAR